MRANKRRGGQSFVVPLLKVTPGKDPSGGRGLFSAPVGGKRNFRQFVHDEYEISKKPHTVTVLTVTTGSSSTRVWESATCSAPEKHAKSPVGKRRRKNGEKKTAPISAALKIHSVCVRGVKKIQDTGEKTGSNITTIVPPIFRR
jgi:hypothetical protein